MKTKKLLKKIERYSKRKGYRDGLTLVIEADESGALYSTIYPMADSDNLVFAFNNLKELREELDYDNN